MADYTHIQKTSSTNWIIGAIVVVLILLFVVFAGGSGTGTDDAAVGPDGTPLLAPAATPEPAPAAAD